MGGIEDIEQAKIKVYPNPVKDDLYIQTDTELTKVEFYNLQDIFVHQPISTTSINVSHLSRSIYTMNVFANKTAFSYKIVKQ